MLYNVTAEVLKNHVLYRAV